MHDMTEQNLRAAFAGESQAHMKYLIFADKAEEEGYPNIARLFRAIAHAERVHATNHFNVLGELDGSSDNLMAAVNGENYEVDEMYPAFDAVAKMQGERGAQRSIHYAIEAEKIHAALYTQAKESVEAGSDLNIKKVQICEICGYTSIGDVPDRCPVCGALKDKFTAF